MEVKHEEHEGHEEQARPPEHLERLATIIVDSAFKVHKVLGPGLLESTYEHCLLHELQMRGLQCRCQVPMPIIYDGMKLDAGFRLDLVVNDQILVEIKAVDMLTRLHDAQLLTYLKFSRYEIGFLMNFNVELFKHGLKRFIM
jgi:GxxExxY protein